MFKRMTIVEELPKDKQFAAMWVFAGEVWCDTFKYDKEIGYYYKYDAASDDFGGRTYDDNLNLVNSAWVTLQIFVVEEG